MKTYEDGLNDAWECVRKIACIPKNGGLPPEVILEIFNDRRIYMIIEKFTLVEVIAKIKEYEENKMGYTRYWNRTEKPLDEDFVNFCNSVFKTCDKLGVKICNAWGENTPIVTTDVIAFNGDGSKNLDHELFVLDDRIGYNFCKTARKPYDYAVRTILREALVRGFVIGVRDDGDNEDIVSDKEYTVD